MSKLHLAFVGIFSIVLADLGIACAHRSAAIDASRFSTAPPPSSCVYVGRASGSATEATQSLALAHAREDLWVDADRRGGNYVQVTGQDTVKVEMALDAYEVRLEARIYRCAQPGDGTAVATITDDGGMPGGDDGGQRLAAVPLSCPPSTEARPLDPADGPGWQCARKIGERWVAEGPYVLSWNSGATRTEGSFENGKRSGRWTTYYANGQLRERAAFREGLLEGCAEEFDVDGTALAPRCWGDAGDGASSERDAAALKRP